jgi:two-component system NarL family sensor kinase
MTTVDRFFDHLSAEPVRVAALLRPPMIVLIYLIVDIVDIHSWLPVVYDSAIVSYFIASLGWAGFVLRGAVPRWAGWVSTLVDVAAVVTLCLASGGATAWLLPVFFLLPISIAFQERPWLTGVLGLLTAGAYLGVWVVYSKRDDTVGLPNIVYLHFAFLLWLAVATTALCLVLARRRTRVLALLEARRQLVSESMRADERNSRELAESLHDGPLQELLAARLELDELSERIDDPVLDAVRATLAGTATQLRSTLRTLHPAVLSELGLTAALAELLRQYRTRGTFAVFGELDEVGKPPAQDLLYRAARELLANASKHARPSAVQVWLKRSGDVVTLTVTDDGVGFDPAILEERIAEGHIGLASLMTRVESMGGSMQITAAPGGGTQTTVTTPVGAG